ncbi:unnamed protein product [Chironomus riparius]|uniref:C2H2-type domain-containing protein n=1 Tax=Chironomus riparius TaxID=315576 RepID=A0A9N9RJV1_9DIPT|nr:unnamed protein product [Chironomus riparius]
MEVCRICNLEKSQADLKITLDQLASEKLSYKCYFEKFSGSSYSNDSSLPQKICITCEAEINLFIIKADSWRRNERTYHRRLKRKPSEPPVKEAKDDTAPKKEVIKKAKLMSVRNSFDDVRKLFQLNDKDPLKDFEKFSRIMVDQENLELDGEISFKWLQDNVVTKRVWSEMIFDCSCKTKVSSLIGYLNHLKTHGNTLKLRCPENCNEIFTSLSPFINHFVSQHHYEYLCYCCICCGKIFYNIPALINHYESKHPNIQNLYMCVECGSYCQDLKYLSSHKNLHYPIADKEIKTVDQVDTKVNAQVKNKVNAQVDTKFNAQVETKVEEVKTSVPDKEYEFLLETDISFCATKKPRRKLRSKNNMTVPEQSFAVKSFMNLNKTTRTYHPKTREFDETSSRPTFPCQFEGCERILLTKSGYDYHMRVHNDIKPFKCDYCEKSFRSTQLKNSHTRNAHASE